MRRVLLMLCLALTLGGCGNLPIQPQGVDCNSSFAKDLEECGGQGGTGGTGGLTQVPLETQGPTEIPVTPTPAFVRSEYYDGLMTRFGAYGIEMDGFNPASKPPYHEVVEPFSASADVVNLTINRFNVIEGLQLFIVVLKMDDENYESQAGNTFNCIKVDASRFPERQKKLNEDGSEATTPDGKPVWIVKDMFYPDSKDQWVYVCGEPGHFVHGYNGWAKFMTLDPSQRGEVIVRTCDSLNECKERTAEPIPPTQAPAPQSTATAP